MLIYWKRILKSALSGFKRNGWLTLVAVFIMSQALLIISLFASINLVIGSSIQAVNDRIDVAVFFKETVPENDALVLRDKVASWDGVTEVIFVSSQEALDKFLAENRNRVAIRDVIPAEENFLPASLEVKVTDSAIIEQVIERILRSEDAALISETSLQDNQQLIKRLRDVGSFIQRTSLLLAGVFVIIALLIIFNTIRITIFTRKDEIEIMKLVGATDSYIRWPFIIEGMLYGVMATLLTSFLLYVGYLILISPLMEGYVIATVENPIFSFGFFAFLLVIQLIIGLGVGGFSSYLATKKHLNV